LGHMKAYVASKTSSCFFSRYICTGWLILARTFNAAFSIIALVPRLSYTMLYKKMMS